MNAVSLPLLIGEKVFVPRFVSSVAEQVSVEDTEVAKLPTYSCWTMHSFIVVFNP